MIGGILSVIPLEFQENINRYLWRSLCNYPVLGGTAAGAREYNVPVRTSPCLLMPTCFI